MKHFKLLLRILIALIAVFTWGFCWSIAVRISGLEIPILTAGGNVVGGLLIGKYIIYDLGKK